MKPARDAGAALWLPAIQAGLALNRQDPAEAVNDLEAASPIELGQILFLTNLSCLYPTYIPGEAYLALGQSTAAASSSRKSSTTPASYGTAGREPYASWTSACERS